MERASRNVSRDTWATRSSASTSRSSIQRKQSSPATARRCSRPPRTTVASKIREGDMRRNGVHRASQSPRARANHSRPSASMSSAPMRRPPATKASFPFITTKRSSPRAADDAPSSCAQRGLAHLAAARNVPRVDGRGAARAVRSATIAARVRRCLNLSAEAEPYSRRALRASRPARRSRSCTCSGKGRSSSGSRCRRKTSRPALIHTSRCR